jgi:FKBP12-rapamycin complex-associated protein
MSVLRENRDSVMAMLEAFVYDPLISWRLLANNNAGAETAVPIASGVSGNLRSQASNEDDAGTSKSSVEQLRVQMAAGSLLGGGGAGPGAVAQSLVNRNQSLRTQATNLAPGPMLGEDGEPLQENLNAR